MTLARLENDSRVTIRRRGSPDSDGAAVVYWMQRASDNPGLDMAVELGNELRKRVVAILA